MVLLLILDVFKNLIYKRFTNRISCIACLPCKFRVQHLLLINKVRAAPFNLLDNFSNGMLHTKQKQAVHMIWYAIYNANKATKPLKLVLDKTKQWHFHLRSD